MNPPLTNTELFILGLYKERLDKLYSEDPGESRNISIRDVLAEVYLNLIYPNLTEIFEPLYYQIETQVRTGRDAREYTMEWLSSFYEPEVSRTICDIMLLDDLNRKDFNFKQVRDFLLANHKDYELIFASPENLRPLI